VSIRTPQHTRIARRDRLTVHVEELLDRRLDAPTGAHGLKHDAEYHSIRIIYHPDDGLGGEIVHELEQLDPTGPPVARGRARRACARV